MTEQQKALVDLFKSIGALVAGLSAFVGHIVQIRQAINGEPHWFWLSVFVALTVIVCIFVVVKKTSIGAKFGQETRIHLFRPWSRVVCKVILGLIVLSPLLLLLKPSEAKRFNILIANIDGPASGQYRVTESLIEDLRKATAGYPNVKIAALGRSVTVQDGGEVARATGKKENADVVIWGWFAVSNSKIRITLHCELFGAVASLWKNSTDQSGVFSISKLENFELQKELGDDMTALALFFVGQSRLKNHDDQGAVEVLSQAVDHLNSKDTLSEAADIYFTRGYCYSNLRSIAMSRKAAEDYSMAISLRTNFTDAYLNRASSYLNVNMTAEALADCDRALQLVPDHPVALANRSAAFIRLGRIDEAVRDAEVACAKVPWFTGYRLFLAQALSAKGETEKAIFECNEFLIREPTNGSALLLRASIYRRVRRFDEAIRDCTVVLGIPNMEADACCERGQAYWDKGDCQKSADDFSAFLRFHPESAEVHCLRAQMFEDLGQHALAIADLDFAVAAKSNLVHTPIQIVYCLRGVAQSQLGNLPAAVTNFSMALQFDPNYVEPRMRRASVLLRQGSFTNALEDLSRVIERDTNSPAVFYNRGVVYMQLNMPSNAITDFSRSISLDMNPAEAFCYRGAAYFGLNMLSNALADLSTSISRDTTNLNAYAMRGIVYLGLGSLDEAIRDCEKTLHVTNQPVALENAHKLWSGILEIAQNPAHRENQLALGRQPSPEGKRVHALLIGARGGSLADYEQLRLLAEGTNAIANWAKTAVGNVVQYFEVYRESMFLKRSFFMDPARLKPMPVSIDEAVFNQLRSSDWAQRATAVSYLAGKKKASTVPHMCDAVLNETNLYVISDITKALNEITGTRHGPLAVRSVSNWWSANIHEQAYQTPFTASQRYWNYLTLPPDQAKQALGVLEQTIAAEPTAYWARSFRAGCYIVLHEFDLAEKDLAEVEKASPQLCWFLFYRTLLYYAEGKPDQVESLNELLALYPGFEANARQLLPGNVVSDPRIKWPQKN